MSAQSFRELAIDRPANVVLARALDGLAWIIAVVGALLWSLDGPLRTDFWVEVAVLSIAVLIAHYGFGHWLGLYDRRFERGSFLELKALLGTVLSAAVLIGVPVIFLSGLTGIPRETMLLALVIAVPIMAGIRYLGRVHRETARFPVGSKQLTLIYGAGDLGNHLIRGMLTDRLSPYRPIGIIDDNPQKLGMRIQGIPVLGSSAELGHIVRDTGATSLIVSIARANAQLLQRITDKGDAVGLRVLVFPSLEEVLEGKSRLRDVRDIAIEDLIGRHPVETNVESMAGYLRGKRILVTGAGGSIGSELCRQISKYSPGELIMLDRDETGLQSTQLMLEGNGLLTNRNIVLADIRDQEALKQIFDDRRPEVVFHAAALKHLPMLERFPEEAWKTNVLGSFNVIEAALAADVQTFVNISTDKAADPTSVLGFSKKLAERLTAWAAMESGKHYLSVRFGNVLGSRGSLVPLFAAMIEAGGPLTITHPEVTRFFMTIPEACHLVVQAGGIGNSGEVLILDMGEAVSILDIARRMIAKSGRDIAIIYTGLRDGEKLHEELVGEAESTTRPVHPKISHTRASPLSPDELRSLDWYTAIGRGTS